MKRRLIIVIVLLKKEKGSCSRITLNMMGSGSLERKLDKVKDKIFGQMDQCTMAGGKTIKPTAKADSFTLTVTSTLVTGLTIKPTDLVPMIMPTDLNM